MEIERKYLVKTLPDHLDQYESKKIAQGYPVSYTHLDVYKRQVLLNSKNLFSI